MTPLAVTALVTDLASGAAGVALLVIVWRKRWHLVGVWRRNRHAARHAARLRRQVGPGVPVTLIPSTFSLAVMTAGIATIVACSVYSAVFALSEAVDLLAGRDPW